MSQDVGDQPAPKKILILGMDRVGKSELAKFLTGQTTGQDSPLGATVIESSFKYPKEGGGEEIVQVEIWDTKGGQGNGTVVAPLYCDTSLALLVVSADNSNTFNEVSLYVSNFGENKPNFILICNKIDDRGDVSTTDFEELAMKSTIDNYIEVSLLEGTNTERLKELVMNTLRAPPPKPVKKKTRSGGCCLVI